MGGKHLRSILLALIAVLVGFKSAVTAVEAGPRFGRAAIGPCRLEPAQPAPQEAVPSHAVGCIVLYRPNGRAIQSEEPEGDTETGLVKTSSSANMASSTQHDAAERAQQGVGDYTSRMMARSDESAASHPILSPAKTAALAHFGRSVASTSSIRRPKRCHYIGTFFHRIDCNAPANATSVPYSHAPAATPAHSSSP
ncbi:hypothetical protein JCM3774_004222 [Rhodotorula dairenensis]